MLAPTTPLRYACPCGEIIIEVAGPSWTAWDLAVARSEENATTYLRARQPWRLDVDARHAGS